MTIAPSSRVSAVRPAAERGRPASRARHLAGFWFVASAFLTAMAFSTVPAPLYVLYQARDGFSTFMITLVFAAYAAGVVTSLVLAGHVSDWVGRKRIILPALGLELVAALLFAASPALPVLLVARFVSGLGIGMLTATATAHLHDLHRRARPEASLQRFEVVSTAANIGGLGLGPLVAGVLAQYVDAPLRTPYVVFLVLLGIGVVLVMLTPETVEERLVRPVYRPQRLSTDHGDRRRYAAAVAAGLASFAVFGIFTSVVPGFVGGALHQRSSVLAGVVVFAVFGSAAAGQSLTGRMRPAAKRALGLIAEAVGMVGLTVAMHAASVPGLLVAGAVTGVGAGVLFASAVGGITALAAPDRRGEALAGFFLISYLGLSLPALGIGLAVSYIPVLTAMTWLTAALLVTLLVVAALSGTPPFFRAAAGRRLRSGRH